MKARNYLDGVPQSCWTAAAPTATRSPYGGRSKCDVVVVGAGIVGLSAALALGEAGRKVVVLEARRVGRQVTGGSTAKITTQHGLIYRHLIDHVGRELAQAYATANQAGIRQIRDWIEAYRIDCSLESKSAYAYAVSPGWREAIEREAQAAAGLGLDARVLDAAPLPFATSAALEFPDQGQFNPANYLAGLARAVEGNGGRVHEKSRAMQFERDGDGWRVVTDGGAVHAGHLVMATNMTVQSPAGYATRTQPHSHVALAFRTMEAEPISGMFIGVDEPTHSLRTGADDKGSLLVALGPRFDTGSDGDVAARFRDLERWTRERLPVGEVAWRWCNEDYDTADRMPFVGQPDAEKAPGFHVATGFNAWGISNGTAAALTIAAEISTGRRLWGSLYDPTRPSPEDFHRDGQSQSTRTEVDGLAPGEGGVISRGDEKIAVWRDDDGSLHAVSASCTHKGCTVTWNNADRTWDCPCHGSLFEAGGEVIHGPARERLAPRSL